MQADLIKRISERYGHRKKMKSAYDQIITLSVNSNSGERVLKMAASPNGGSYRLIDEGMVVTASGEPDFYIKKGSVKEFYDSLSDDYVGSINIGHMDFVHFPFLTGTWSKSDLSVVDIGDGRQGLNITPHFDEESVFIKELKRADYSIGLSIEAPFHVDEESTLELGVEVVDKFKILDIAIVGEAGNVTSGGIFLSTKGEQRMSFLNDMLKKHLNAKKDPDAQDPKTDPKNPAEPPAEPPADPKKPDEPGAEEMTDEEIAELVKKAGEIIEEQEQVEELVTTMDKQLDEVEKELAATKEELAEAKKQLAAKEEGVNSALSRFKNLAADYGKSQEAKQKELEAKQKEEEAKKAKLSDDGWGGVE